MGDPDASPHARSLPEGAVGVRAFRWYTLAAWGGLTGLTLARLFAATGGHLVYTLDDPYIHLSVGEQLLRGGYGINTGEYASPSSSILWPVVVAGLLAGGLGDWGPLLLNLIATALSLWILAGQLWTHGVDARGRTALAGLMLGTALVLAVNAVALPLTGMEHPLHVLGALLALRGVHRLSQDGSDGRRGNAETAVGVLLCATVRFEGLALALLVIAALALLGRVRLAGGLLVAVGALVAAYAAVMHALGLPVLPSSVLVKSNLADAAVGGGGVPLVRGVLRTVDQALQNRWGVLFALTAGALGTCAVSVRGEARRVRPVLLVAAGTLLAHVAAGRYGWFGRYEVYAVAVGVFGLATAGLPSRRPLLLTALLLGVAVPYLEVTYRTPAAARNVHEQQWQMRRFVTAFFPGPVAVNDIGLTSYRNDGYVLDLFGLGSEEARRLYRDGAIAPGSLERLVAARGIPLVMVYDEWFPQVPASWCRLGTLVTSHVTAASGRVAFYAASPPAVGALRAALGRFARTLPAGARFEMAAGRDGGCPAGG